MRRKEGGWTTLERGGDPTSIYEAAMEFQRRGTRFLVIPGKETGTGSARPWAAKGTLLLGVRAVIVESFERIHRPNLVGSGVMPLEFRAADTRHSLGLTGFETFDLEGLE